MGQKKIVKYSLLLLLICFIFILLDIFARHLYQLCWFSNVNISKDVNLSEAFFSTLEIFSTLFIAWWITSKLSSSRYEKELTVDELKELVKYVRNFKKLDTPEITMDKSQELLDEGMFVVQTINTFHPKIETARLSDSIFNLFEASTKIEDIDKHMINKNSNFLVLKIKEFIKLINN